MPNPHQIFRPRGLICFIFLLIAMLLHPLNAAPQPNTPAAQENLLALSKNELQRRLLTYINNLRTLESRFKERSAKRTVEGTLFIQRPTPGSKAMGQFKFVYPPQPNPAAIEITSQGRIIYVRDHRKKSTEKVALESTPLMLFLRSELRLGQFVEAKSLVTQGNYIYWRLGEPEATSTSNATVTFIFSIKPFKLVGWTIHDFQEDQTLVTLDHAKENNPLPPNVFALPKSS